MKKILQYFIFLGLMTFPTCKQEPPPPPPPRDSALLAEAGPDQMIILPQDSTVLDGSGSKDKDGKIINYSWSKIAGPASYVFTDSTAARTLVKNLLNGVYWFELTVKSTSGSIAKDRVQIKVISRTTPPPVCNGHYPFFNVSITEIGNLSGARSPSVAATGSIVVFAGGANRIDNNCEGMFCNTLPSSAIDIYDAYSHAWSTAQLSQARQGMGAVSCGNKLFFAGGSNFELYFNNGTVYDNIDIYDVSTNMWTVDHLSQPRSYVTAAVLANKVFFAGGTEDGMSGSTRVDIYDVTTNSWSIGELSVPRYSIDVVVDGNKIYFVGGDTWDDNVGDVSRIIDIFDASTNRWSTSNLEEQYYALTDVMVGNTNYWIYYGYANEVKIKNMSTGAEVNGCAPYSETLTINNDIIFPGDNLASITIYNTVTGQWSVGIVTETLPFWAPIVTLNNTLYTGGGLFETVNYTYANKVYALNW